MVFKESGLGIRAEGLLSRNSGSAILLGNFPKLLFPKWGKFI